VSEAIYDFPVTWRPPVNTRKMLVQMRWDAEFISAVDKWRSGRDISRARAIYELTAIGLADQALRAARRRKRVSNASPLPTPATPSVAT
jgi:hypothetical protein